MHETALTNGDFFFKTYLENRETKSRLVEIGSQDVNGSLRMVCPKDVEYIGLDFAEGNGVDIILDDPYTLPFKDNSVDYCVASSVFEHSEMFWLLFVEILRILKPSGLFYLNVPSNGTFHRYPVDCWRFYPDSGSALANWGRRAGFNSALLESFTAYQKHSEWNDFVAVFLKDASHINRYPKRILNTHKDFYNGLVIGKAEFINHKEFPEDMVKIQAIEAIASGKLAVR
jgi:SAM-dependent methyltransferase